MQKYQDAVLSLINGATKPVAGATVLVKSYPAGTTATIYSDSGTSTKANPTSTDANGMFSFYAADGRYSLEVSGSLISTATVTDVLLEDVTDGFSEFGLASSLSATDLMPLDQAGTTRKSLLSSIADWILKTYAGFTQPGTGAIPENLQSRERWVVNVTDYLSDVDRAALRAGSSVDATTAFTNAATVVGAGGTIIVAAGTFLLSDWTPTFQIHIVGSGMEGTTLQAKAGATYAIVFAGLLYCSVSNLSIDGNTKTSNGLQLKGGAVLGSQGHQFQSVRFKNCIVGTKVDTAAATQADKNIYIRCRWTDNTTGLWVNSVNAQCQLLLGGSFDTHTTAIRLTSGALGWISGNVQNATTSFLLDGPNIVWLSLQDVMTESTTRDIDGFTPAWPTQGVWLKNCFLQGVTNTVRMASNGSILRAQQTTFSVGSIAVSGNDCVFIDDFCTLAGGAVYTPTGTNDRRHSTTQNGITLYGGAAGATTTFDLANLTGNLTVGGTSNITGVSTIAAALRSADGSKSAPGYAFTNGTNSGRYLRSGVMEDSLAGVAMLQIGGVNLVFNGAFALAGGDVATTPPDVFLTRDAANTIALKNGNADQLLRSYGANNGYWERGSASELLTIAAAATTDTSANLLPANAIIEAVTGRVTTVIPTAATFTIGDATIPARFATGVAVAAGTTAVGLTHVDQTGTSGPKQTAAAKVRITPNLTPGAATGVVRITVFYRAFVAPTS